MRKLKKPKRGGSGGGARQSRLHMAPLVPSSVALGLRDIERLAGEGDLNGALSMAQELNLRFPGQEPVLTLLLAVATAAEDAFLCMTAVEGLARIRPDAPDILMAWPGVYMASGRPALGLHALDRLARWMESPENRGQLSKGDREVAREMLARRPEVAAAVSDDMAASGLEGEDGLEIAWRIELQTLRLEQARPADVRALTDEILAIRPDYIPALNNLALAEWLDLDADAAIATCRRVLAREPDNVHALSNLSRFLLLTGDAAGARDAAAALRRSKAPAVIGPLKVMEAFTCLGDDAEVLRVFDEEYPGEAAAVERREALLPRGRSLILEPEMPSFDAGRDEAQAYHLAAVAAMRLGRESVARGLWRIAAETDPDNSAAAENLANLNKPAGEREAPWAFPGNYWLPMQMIEDLFDRIEERTTGPAGRARGEDDMEKRLESALQGTFRRYPLIATAIPILLDRGDPMARSLAVMFATSVHTPEMNAALAEYARSDRGPDLARMQAAQAAIQAGAIPSGAVRMWMKGEWRDVLLLGWEIGDESEDVRRHSARVRSILEKGVDALSARDAATAERRFREALALEPDAPDILNNLAGALEAQGKAADFDGIVRTIFERHPDYMIGRINRALLCIDDGRLDEARSLLEPLMKRRRLSFGEFRALMGVQIRLHLAEGDRDAAKTWLDMFDAADMPDSPLIETLRRELATVGSERRSRRSARQASPPRRRWM